MISVIVPVYKAESYLEGCVESILSQEYKDIELLLVDDGSPDGCPEICDRLAAGDPRIKAIHKPNGGASSARNAGIDAASGEFVMFVDSDDSLLPYAAGFLLSLIENYGADMAMGTFDDLEIPLPPEEYREKSFLRSETAGFIFRNLGNTYASAIWAKLYRREKLPRFAEELRIGEDILFNLEFIKNAKGIVFSNRRVYRYRRNVGTSVTNSYYPGKHRMYIESYRRMRAAAEEMNGDTGQLNELRHHLVRMLLNCMTCVYIQQGGTAEWKKAEIKGICLDPDVAREVKEWSATGAKDKLLRGFLIKANSAALYRLCALEISRQKAERKR